MLRDVVIAATPENMAAAHALAAVTGFAAAPIDARRFPDGETRVRANGAAETTILVHALDHPDEKLTPLILAASALRDLGAETIILVAPYLCYMRQDKAFSSGEAVSQRVIAKMLSPWIDGLVTVEPHLHRVKSLDLVFPDIRAVALSASPVLAEMIMARGARDNTLLVGPDEEARAWTQRTAQCANIPYTVLSKVRHGDRTVSVSADDKTRFAGKHVCLLDDVVSSGATLAAACRMVLDSGAASAEALVVHALCSAEDLEALRAAGLDGVRSTDTIAHVTNAGAVAPLIAEALRREFIT